MKVMSFKTFISHKVDARLNGDDREWMVSTDGDDLVLTSGECIFMISVDDLSALAQHCMSPCQ